MMQKLSPSAHHRTTLSGYIFATKALIDNRKKLLSSNICTACSYNMVNFGLLATEIVSLVWGTPANFNGFRVLAALLHSHTAALNRRRHLYSAGRPSRWALAHISSLWCRILKVCERAVGCDVWTVVLAVVLPRRPLDSVRHLAPYHNAARR